jgi:hypothetical protein
VLLIWLAGAMLSIVRASSIVPIGAVVLMTTVCASGVVTDENCAHRAAPGLLPAMSALSEAATSREVTLSPFAKVASPPWPPVAR